MWTAWCGRFRKMGSATTYRSWDLLTASPRSQETRSFPNNVRRLWQTGSVPMELTYKWPGFQMRCRWAITTQKKVNRKTAASKYGRGDAGYCKTYDGRATSRPVSTGRKNWRRRNGRGVARPPSGAWDVRGYQVSGARPGWTSRRGAALSGRGQTASPAKPSQYR